MDPSIVESCLYSVSRVVYDMCVEQTSTIDVNHMLFPLERLSSLPFCKY